MTNTNNFYNINDLLMCKLKYDFSFFLFIANPVVENELEELELLLRQKLKQETVSYILFCGEIKF